MENAVDALKMGAFVLIFACALTIAIMTLSQASATSNAMIYSQDEKNYYSYLDEEKYVNRGAFITSRTVKLDSIIPTLYRYNKERYKIIFNGTEELYRRRDGTKVYCLDLDEEMKNEEPWQGNQEATKDNIDKIVKEVLYKYQGRNFIEEIGIIKDETDLNKQEKRIIKYTLQ